MLRKPPNWRFRSEILQFIFYSTHVHFSGVHPRQYKSRFGPRSWTNFFFTKSYLFPLLKKPPNGRFRSGILRFIFFFTHVRSLGVHPGQYKSRFGSRSFTNFFFTKNYLFQFLRKPPNWRFWSEILQFIFFSTHVQFSGVHPGQYKSRFGPRSWRNFFFNKSYLFQLPKKSLNGRFRSGIVLFIFFFTQVWSSEVHPGQYKIRFGSRSCTNFFSKKCYIFYSLKKPPNWRFRSGIYGLYFFPHMFGSQEYTLVNIKVVSALVPERIFVPRKVIYFSC